MDVPQQDEGFDNLSRIAVVFSSLSALFGVYFVLFVVAIWATYRRDAASYKRLRIVTVLLFLDLLIHYLTRGIIFNETRKRFQQADAETKWILPVLFIGSVTVTMAGLLSDGLVAWRFYVIYERKRWALYVPATSVILNALLGFAGDLQYLFIYRNVMRYLSRFLGIAFNIAAAWGWCMLAMNTLLTAGIIGKIIVVARRAPTPRNSLGNRLPYTVVIEAIVESALVNCIGLLLYEISSIAPHGRVEPNFDVGYVMFCILPIFFGISQCLITVRLCFVETAMTGAPSNSRLINTCSSGSTRRPVSSNTSQESGSMPHVTFLEPKTLRYCQELETPCINIGFSPESYTETCDSAKDIV